jgi:GNAT superfamily N-acetyltransferase
MNGELPLLVTDADDELRAVLDKEIYAFNVAATGHDDGRMLCLSVRAEDGELLAGLCGWTWGGCGYIEFLWVSGDHRGGGLGTRLLAAAEREIRLRGCGQVALSTHSFQAPGFYRRAGYSECGRTPAYPRGHEQIHLVKRLSLGQQHSRPDGLLPRSQDHPPPGGGERVHDLEAATRLGDHIRRPENRLSAAPVRDHADHPAGITLPGQFHPGEVGVRRG